MSNLNIKAGCGILLFAFTVWIVAALLQAGILFFLLPNLGIDLGYKECLVAAVIARTFIPNTGSQQSRAS